MMAVHMGQEVFLPWQYSIEGLARALTTNQNCAVTVLLHQCLTNRDFAVEDTFPQQRSVIMFANSIPAQVRCHLMS